MNLHGIAEVITALAALAAAIAGILAAVKSSKAHDEAKSARELASQIQTTIAPMIQQGQRQTFHINVGTVGTVGQGQLTTPASIFQSHAQEEPNQQPPRLDERNED